MKSCEAKIAKPIIGDEEINAVVNVLKSGWIVQGPLVEKFEKEFSRYIGVKHAVATSSGTAALRITLQALGIGEGDEVIVPCFTFFSTASTVLMVKAKPVFADIELETYTIDPESVLERITPKTKAIIAVHLYGHPADMKALREIAEDHKLIIIEDAAQAHGARTPQGMVGSLGDAGVFSFYATKNITTGEGGMITTNRDDVAYLARLLRDHGQVQKYLHVLIGDNSRMTDIQAAIGLVQLRKLDKLNEVRRRNALMLNKLLSTTKLILPREKPGYYHVYHQYVVRVEESRVGVKRDELAQRLKKRGVETAIHYPRALPDQPVFRALGYPPAEIICPNSAKAAREVLSLPIHPGLTEDQIKCIAEAVKEALST